MGRREVCAEDRASSVEMKCLCSKYAVRLGPGLHPELVPLAPPPPSRHRWRRVTPTSAVPMSAPRTTCLPLSLKAPCDARPSRQIIQVFSRHHILSLICEAGSRD